MATFRELVVTEGGQARVTEDWAQGRATFGGLLVAQAVHAALPNVPAGRRLRALAASFVAPVAPGALRLDAQTLHTGRALTQVEVRVSGERGLGVVVLLSFGSGRPADAAVAAPAAPADPVTLELVHVPGVTPTFTAHYRYRFGAHPLPFSGDVRASVGGTIRPAEPDRVDLLAALAMLDAWPAPVLPLLRAPAPASTVLWHVHVHADPPDTGWDAGAEWRYEAVATSAGGGYAEADARLWTPDGALLLSGRQLVVEFSGRN